MAYVDSKLAEMSPPANPPPRSSHEPAQIDLHEQARDAHAPGPVLDAQALGQRPDPKSGERTVQQAQERSSRVYQRPTKRRPPPAREQTDVARDSMIEQLMGENQVPLYDRTEPKPNEDDEEGIDNDAAAAEAFKAQLLADLEQNKRRPPLSKSTGTAPTGPKLGGSRAQREKMRALEEAKGSASKK